MFHLSDAYECDPAPVPIIDSLVEILEEFLEADFPGAAPPCEPTAELPGPQKVTILEARYRARTELFSTADARFTARPQSDRFGLLMNKNANGSKSPAALTTRDAGGEHPAPVPSYKRRRA